MLGGCGGRLQHEGARGGSEEKVFGRLEIEVDKGCPLQGRVEQGGRGRVVVSVGLDKENAGDPIVLFSIILWLDCIFLQPHVVYGNMFQLAPARFCQEFSGKSQQIVLQEARAHAQRLSNSANE